MALTKRQRQIYDYIRSFIEENGYSPSLEEIGRAFGLSSVATVHKHVTNLVRKGLLRRTWNQNRSIDIVREDSAPRAVEVPILGRIVGGRPVESGDLPERLAIPSWMVGQGRTYVLRADGEAMVGEQIRDGDYVVIEERRGGHNGALAIVLVAGEEPALKRYNMGPEGVRLEGSGEGAVPAHYRAERVEVRGVVRGVLRSC
jgi:repressor LexA